MSKKKDHKKRSKWANLFNSHKLFDVSLILIGLMGPVSEGHCTFGDEVDDGISWDFHSTTTFDYSNTSLYCRSPVFDYESNNYQSFMGDSFSPGFENDLDFLNEYGHFDSPPHQPRPQPVRDPAACVPAIDEDQLSISELVARFERESELETALELTGELPTLNEERTHRFSLASDETIACMEEKKEKGETLESRVQNICNSELGEHGKGKEKGDNQSQRVTQSPDVSDKPLEKPNLVHFTTYFTSHPIPLNYELTSLKDQAGIPTSNMTLEMSQQQAYSYFNNCFGLKQGNAAVGGMGVTISRGRISAIRLYMSSQQ